VPETPPLDGERHARLADLETGLRGLLHFQEVLGQWMAKGKMASIQQRWYYGAMILWADALFMGDRGGDSERGAALRALRDLGRNDLKSILETALAEPINPNGRTLGDAIHRIRNEVLVHHSFDFEEQGAALLYTGIPDAEMAPAAFEKLTAAVEAVLAEIKAEKVTLTAKMFLEGTLTDYSRSLDAAPERARAKEKKLRHEQRAAARGRGIVGRSKPTYPDKFGPQ